MAIIGCVKGSYEVQDLDLGKVYRWRPESVLVECECGEQTTLIGSETTCVWCGADHAATIREELATLRTEDEAAHPWHYADNCDGDAGMPC